MNRIDDADFKLLIEKTYQKYRKQIKFLEEYYSDKLSRKGGQKRKIKIVLDYNASTSSYNYYYNTIRISVDNLKHIYMIFPKLFYSLFYTLILHEIGHAIYTDQLPMNEITNVLEDNRIEYQISKWNRRARFGLFRFTFQDIAFMISGKVSNKKDLALALLRTKNNQPFVDLVGDTPKRKDIVEQIIKLDKLYTKESKELGSSWDDKISDQLIGISDDVSMWLDKLIKDYNQDNPPEKGDGEPDDQQDDKEQDENEQGEQEGNEDNNSDESNEDTENDTDEEDSESDNKDGKDKEGKPEDEQGDNENNSGNSDSDDNEGEENKGDSNDGSDDNENEQKDNDTDEGTEQQSNNGGTDSEEKEPTPAKPTPAEINEAEMQELQDELAKMEELGAKMEKEIDNGIGILVNEHEYDGDYEPFKISAFTTARRRGIKGSQKVQRQSGNAKQLNMIRYNRRAYTPKDKLFDKYLEETGKGGKTANVVFYLDISTSMVKGKYYEEYYHKDKLYYCVHYLKSFYDQMHKHLNIRFMVFGKNTYEITRNELEYRFLRPRTESATNPEPIKLKRDEEIIIITDGSFGTELPTYYMRKAHFVLIGVSSHLRYARFGNAKNTYEVHTYEIERGLEKATKGIRDILKG